MITEPPQVWETDSWRAQTKPLHTSTQKKGAVTPQETDPDLPVSVQESLAEAWVDTEYNSASISPSEGGCLYPTIGWPQAKQQGGNIAIPINRKLD